MNQPEKYTIILCWSEEQDVSIGQVQELIGVEASDSRYEGALASNVEAIRALPGEERQALHSCQRTQRPRPMDTRSVG